MADDNVVEIRFGASTDDALDGIAQVRDSLMGLTEPLNLLGGNLDRLGDAYGKALPTDKLDQCSKSFSSVGAAAKDAAAQVQTVGGQMKVAQEQYSATVKLADQAFSATKEHLAAEVRLHEISYSQETAALVAALDQKQQVEGAALAAEFEQQQAALEEKKKAYDQDSNDWNKVQEQEAELLQKLRDKETETDAKYFAERQKLVDQAAEQEARQWKSVADQVSGAFNSQLLKMLQGKESWAQASRKIEADLLLKFIESQVKATPEYLANLAQQVAEYLAGETAKTSAAVAGETIRQGVQTAAGEQSILQTIGNALRAIFASAGQTGAEVSAAVAPAAGPAAPAIGAAAMAAVVASSTGGIYDVGTDYVVRGGLAIIHPGETIVPAGVGQSRGSGRYTGRGLGDTIHAPVSVSISALDSRSVARFFNDNAGHMIRAINKGIKSGAHLGLRTARA